MLKWITSVTLAITVSACGFGLNAQVSQVTLTGIVTDTLAGARGATLGHADAARAAVKAGMAQYALWLPAGKKLYLLEPQATAANYVGQRVTVSGSVTQSAMTHAGQRVNPSTGAVEDFHFVGQDSTPVAGLLTIATVSMPAAH